LLQCNLKETVAECEAFVKTFPEEGAAQFSTVRKRHAGELPAFYRVPSINII